MHPPHVLAWFVLGQVETPTHGWPHVLASPSTPSSRAVLGIRNMDETCWNLVGTGREVCCTHATRGSSFPYLAMRTLGHLLFPFAHSPRASRGWTIRSCGVLQTRGCASCNEDVLVGWLHAPCIEWSGTLPPRCHPVPQARDHVPCAAYQQKGILVCWQRMFLSGLPPRGGGLRGPWSDACGSPCPCKQASKQLAWRHTWRDSSLGFGACDELPGSKYSVTHHRRMPSRLGKEGP